MDWYNSRIQTENFDAEASILTTALLPYPNQI